MLEIKKFSADWCHSCIIMKTSVWPGILEANLDIIFQEINTDKDPEISATFKVLALPTVIFIKDGLEAYRIVGVQQLKTYQDAIDRLK